MPQPSRDQAHVAAYMTGVGDQLATAVRDGDPDAAIRILDQVENDGYPAGARALEDGVRRTSLGPDFDDPQVQH